MQKDAPVMASVPGSQLPYATERVVRMSRIAGKAFLVAAAVTVAGWGVLMATVLATFDDSFGFDDGPGLGE